MPTVFQTLKFRDKTVNEITALTSFEAVCLFGVGFDVMDWERIDFELLNREYIPLQRPIVIDIEPYKRPDGTTNTSYCPGFPVYEFIDNPNIAAVPRMRDLVRHFQELRPDCAVSTYMTPIDFWTRYTNLTDVSMLEKLLIASLPWLRQCDWLVPQFYYPQEFSDAQTRQWTNGVYSLLRKWLPFKLIVPLISPYFKWSIEAADRIPVCIPATALRTRLDMLSDNGATEMIIYYSGKNKYDPTEPYWKVLQEWKNGV